MRINHNLSALNAFNKLISNQIKSSKNKEKLSSGLRINRAGDDAAGLAISEKMRGQIRGLEQATENAQDGISLIQTAEGALNESHAILQRVRELAVQSSNDTYTTEERHKMQSEVNQLGEELEKILQTTTFNHQNILDGTYSKELQIGSNRGELLPITINQIDQHPLGTNSLIYESFEIINGTGKPFEWKIIKDSTVTGTTLQAEYDEATNTATLKIPVTHNDMSEHSAKFMTEYLNDLGVDVMITGKAGVLTQPTPPGQNIYVPTNLSIMTQVNASTAIEAVDKVINQVSNQRAHLGAIQNRLEHTVANLNTMSENLTWAESRIRDVDMAKEMMELTKNHILEQASQAILAQSNQNTQNVLELLK